MTSGNDDDDTVKNRASNIDADNSVITGTLKADKGGKHNLGLPVISHSSSSSSPNIPTGTDVRAGSHSWSDGTSGFSSGTDEAAGSGSVAGIGSGSVSVVDISGVSQFLAGSSVLSTVGMGSGSEVVTDVMRVWTLGTESS